MTYPAVTLLLLISAFFCSANALERPGEEELLKQINRHMGYVKPESQHIFSFEFRNKGGYIDGNKYFMKLDAKTFFNENIRDVKHIIGQRAYRHLKKRFGNIKKGALLEQKYDVTFVYVNNYWELDKKDVRLIKEQFYAQKEK